LERDEPTATLEALRCRDGHAIERGGPLEDARRLRERGRAEALDRQALVARESSDGDGPVEARRIERAAGEACGAVALVGARSRDVARRLELSEAREPAGVHGAELGPRWDAQEARALPPLGVLVAAGDDEDVLAAGVGERERQDVPRVVGV